MIDALPLPGMPPAPRRQTRAERGGLTVARWQAVRTEPGVLSRFAALAWFPAHPDWLPEPPPGSPSRADAPGPPAEPSRVPAHRAEPVSSREPTEPSRLSEFPTRPEFDGIPNTTGISGDSISDDPLDWCIPWLGAISSTGHGSFRVLPPKEASGKGVAPAHLVAWVIAHGPIDRDGPAGGRGQIELCHRCDEHGCINVRHLVLGDQRLNRREAYSRGRSGPLADVRGPAGRARDIKAAVLAGIAAGEPVEQIRARQLAAAAAGMPNAMF